MPDDLPGDDDPLEELRERIRATQAAAEHLAGEAAAAREDAEAGQTPPPGWQSTAEQRRNAEEMRGLVAIISGLRDLIPQELVDEFRELLRQLLLLLRALVDWWVSRLDGALVGPPRAEAAPAPSSRTSPLTEPVASVFLYLYSYAIAAIGLLSIDALVWWAGRPNRMREKETADREFFDANGHWPDEERPG